MSTYLPPTNEPLPGGLTLDQFIQTVLVGITGFDPTLVRPKWQVAPIKRPDITVNWMAFGIQEDNAQANAFVEENDIGSLSTLGRQTAISIQCSFYGPNAYDNAGAFRDGFQIFQNLAALRSADMGFTETTQIMRAPELINQQWFNRAEMTLVLARRVIRTYQVVSFASVGGFIHTVLNGDNYNSEWQTPPEV